MNYSPVGYAIAYLSSRNGQDVLNNIISGAYKDIPSQELAGGLLDMIVNKDKPSERSRVPIFQQNIDDFAALIDQLREANARGEPVTNDDLLAFLGKDQSRQSAKGIDGSDVFKKLSPDELSYIRGLYITNPAVFATMLGVKALGETTGAVGDILANKQFAKADAFNTTRGLSAILPSVIEQRAAIAARARQEKGQNIKSITDAVKNTVDFAGGTIGADNIAAKTGIAQRVNPLNNGAFQEIGRQTRRAYGL